MSKASEALEDQLCSAMSDLSLYKHSTLPDGAIRLLKLFPASKPEEPLRGELIHNQLTQALEYEAISYVWGDPVFDQTLYLDEASLKITQNLFDALRCFRKPDVARMLWIDAVCINQTDLEEKSQQIPMMGNIYRYAHAVLAWLGNAENVKIDNKNLELAGALAFAGRGIFRPATSIYLLHDLPQLLKEVGENQGDRWEKVFKICGMDDKINPFGFRQLCSSAWFTRMWIVQEVALAKNLFMHLGDNIIEWYHFERLCVIVWLYVESGHPHDNVTWQTFLSYCWPVVQAKHDVRDAERKSPIHALDTWFRHVAIFSTRKCRDAQDHVYALLGLLPTKTGVEIVPDYTKDSAEVFTQAADIALRRAVLQNLCSAGTWRRTIHKEHGNTCQPDYLPSWVPDYSSLTLDEALPPWLSNGFGEEQMVDRDSPQGIKLYPSKHKHVFGFEGAIFDIVEHCWSLTDVEMAADMSSTDKLPNKSCVDYVRKIGMIKNLHSQVKKHVKHMTYLGSPEKWEVMCLRTLAASCDTYTIWTGSGPLFGFDPKTLTMLKALDIYVTDMLSDTNPLHLQKDENIPGYSPATSKFDASTIAALNLAHQLMAGTLEDYDFFMTKIGVFGLAPKTAGCQKGDFVAFIDMIKVPFLLRSAAPAVEALELRSACYLQNLMLLTLQNRRSLGQRSRIMLV